MFIIVLFTQGTQSTLQKEINLTSTEGVMHIDFVVCP